MKNNYKILIPGGTGFIGYHLCSFFLKKGWRVYSVSKNKPKKNRKIKGVRYILCDIRNIKVLNKKLDDYYDYIINSSGYVDHSKNKSIEQTHYLGCKNLIYKFRQNRPKKFIQIGSSIEYGNQRSPQTENFIRKIDTFSIYGNAKLKCTLFLLALFKKEKYPVTIIRPYLIYGPNQDNNRVIPFVINNSLKGKSFDCSSGNQKRDFLYIDDFVQAIFKSLILSKSDGELINIGSQKPIKIRTMIQTITRMIKKGKPNFSKIKIRNDEPDELYPDIKKAKTILKWFPKVNLEKGLKKTISYYIKNG